MPSAPPGKSRSSWWPAIPASTRTICRSSLSSPTSTWMSSRAKCRRPLLRRQKSSPWRRRRPRRRSRRTRQRRKANPWSFPRRRGKARANLPGLASDTLFPFEPRRQRRAQAERLAVLKLGNLLERTCEVAVVVDEYVRQRVDRASEICLRTREARYDFVIGDVVASLKHAHRHALLRDLDTVDADIAEDDRVALLRRCFAQELHLVAHWIREHGLEHEALALLHQRLAQLVRKMRALPGIDRELARQVVGIHEAQSGRREIHGMEGRFAGAVRSGDGDDDGPRIEGRNHFDLAGLNSRFTKRPTRRVPSSSILTRKPGRPGAGSKCGYGRDARCAA